LNVDFGPLRIREHPYAAGRWAAGRWPYLAHRAPQQVHLEQADDAGYVLRREVEPLSIRDLVDLSGEGAQSRFNRERRYGGRPDNGVGR
jgi:hypothetical protein